MFELFIKRFQNTSIGKNDKEDSSFFKDLEPEVFNLLDSYGGSTFNNGLYRIHTFKSSVSWAAIISEHFPKYLHQVYPFSFDWMGRQFCMHKGRKRLLMFDPATGEDFELQQKISSLHDQDFVDDPDGMLGINLFNRIIKRINKKEIVYNECLGFKIPLFLGGKDSIENYEVQNIEVYWHITMQLLEKTRNLPEGTKINKIDLK